jgi:futalosine hydrolase
MKLLLVYATENEFSLLRNEIKKHELEDNIFKIKHSSVKVLITGSGIVNTTFHLTRELHNNYYDYCLNLGICGSFKSEYKIGDVVRIHKDRFADWGVVEKDGFKDVFDMGLENQDKFPFESGWIYEKDSLINKLNIDLASVEGFTVNTVRARGYDNLDNKYDADVESMEGAAFFYVCRQFDIPCKQIRAISNRVGERDKSKWDFISSLKNLSDYVNDVIIQN